jgi:hypothetical protein
MTDDEPVLDPPELAPIPADTPPLDVVRALGFDPDLVQAVVITDLGMVAIARTMPDLPPTDPAGPEEDPDGDA